MYASCSTLRTSYRKYNHGLDRIPSTCLSIAVIKCYFLSVDVGQMFGDDERYEKRKPSEDLNIVFIFPVLCCKSLPIYPDLPLFWYCFLKFQLFKGVGGGVHRHVDVIGSTYDPWTSTGLFQLATSKGSIAGDLQFHDMDGNYFDCTKTTNVRYLLALWPS